MKNFINKTAVKITIGVVLITSFVLIYIAFLTVKTAQDEFYNATIKFIDNRVFLVRQSPVAPVEVIREQFNQNLLNAIAYSAVLGVLLSITAGAVFSLIITKPLRQITEGIQNLKKSRYQKKLELTGGSEFDEVITEFNELAEELEFQDDLRKDLISDIAHELRTPLTSILAQTQGIKDGVLEPTSARLDLVIHSAERLNHLIDKLQEYTKIRNKTAKLKLKQIHLIKLLNRIKDLREMDLKSKNIELTIDIDESLKIKAEDLLLERAIDNIIDNAIKYSEAKNIKVYFDKVNNKLIISDNGKGVPDEDLRKIFERFYRVEKSRNRETGGLGLGLALVKEIIESHGWEIEALKNEDGGIRFEIKF